MHVESAGDIFILMPDMLGRGETARVFPAYLEGQDPVQVDWAVKLARDRRHNVYIEREHETLIELHSETASPALPNVKIGQSLDGRKALIMEPLLRQSLLAAFESLGDPIDREKLALRAARQYADLLQAMANADISCRDRKLGDLWWAGALETGQLMVTDWNVVDRPANQAVDIRRFGLLWFELMIGNQMLRDFQPKREDFDQIQDKLSYGFWHIIGRALGASLGARFCTIKDLADGLDTLASFYERPPQALVGQAQSDLEQAQANRDRSKADLAWMQFDIAQRLGAGEQRVNIEQARLWAQDPFTQSTPDLLGKLASSRFTEVSAQLGRLKEKTQDTQKAGDIARLWLGFDLLNAVMGAWQEGESTTELAQASQAFAALQNLLVDGVLRPLMDKNGAIAKIGLQEIEQLLHSHLDPLRLDQLDALRQEARFWEFYQGGLRDIDVRPSLAIDALEKAKRMRNVVSHWPALYEPTVEGIEQLIKIAEANRLSALSGERTVQGAKERECETISVAVREDIAKGRWGEAVAELLTAWEQRTDDDRMEEVLEDALGELLQRHAQLAQGRTTPGRLVERLRLVKALLQIPPSLAPDLLGEEQLHRELAELRKLEAKIALEQMELCRDPGRVLEAALRGGYELFDDAALSVAVLQAVRKVGRWDGDRLSQEIERLRDRTERLTSLTDVLEGKRDVLQETLTFFETWQESERAKTGPFFANTLRLYLGAAQAQLEQGVSAQRALEKAERLLASDEVAQLLPSDEYELYWDLYQHLVKVHSSDDCVQQPQSDVTEEQLEEVAS